jgi:hypothetical protein
MVLNRDMAVCQPQGKVTTVLLLFMRLLITLLAAVAVLAQQQLDDHPVVKMVEMGPMGWPIQ